MDRRGRVIAAVAAVAAGGVVAGVSWLAVQPVEGCVLLPSLPPQGACLSRLGTGTTLEPGQSATPFALLVGVAAGGLTWHLASGAAWRRRAVVAAAVALAVGVLTLPVACEWTIPAGRLLHPQELVRRCSNPVGMATPAAKPQDAAMWSIAAGLVSLSIVWLLDLRRRARRESSAR